MVSNQASLKRPQKLNLVMTAEGNTGGKDGKQSSNGSLGVQRTSSPKAGTCVLYVEVNKIRSRCHPYQIESFQCEL